VRSIGPSSTGITWGLVRVGMRSTSWMRPASQGKLLGTCLLGRVFLVVFVRHLFLGDLFLFFPFPSFGCFCCLFLVWDFCGFSFFFCCYICGVIPVVCFGSWVLVVLWFFFVAGKAGFPYCFCCYIWSFCLYLLVLNILSCYQVTSLVRLC